VQRHTVILQYGSDKRKPLTAPRGTLTSVLNVENLGTPGSIRLGGLLKQLPEIGIEASDKALDLLLLAIAVFASDTRISRLRNSQDGWTREIALIVPVSAPRRWTRMGPLLVKSLSFLTGDLWRLKFYQRPVSDKKETERKGLGAVKKVALFSGGLDSLIGAIDLLTSDENLVLVSHYADGSSSVPQDTCFEGLKKGMGQRDLRRVSAFLAIPHGVIDDGAEETQRSRSFLFYALGAFVASGLKQPTSLIVPENGFISINVPMNEVRLGALSTRTTHPYFIAGVQEIFDALGLSLRISNPYQFKTKGEMIEECKDLPLLKKLIPVSMSCARPTAQRYKGIATIHCGYCLPCIVRRAAIRKALHSDPTHYFLSSLTHHKLRAMRAEGRDLRAVRRAAMKVTQHPDLAVSSIFKSGPLLSDQKTLHHYSEVYRRGMLEIWKILKPVRVVGD